MAPNTALMPYGMKPPDPFVRPLEPGIGPPTPAVKLCGWNLKNKTMMVRIGTATFHQVSVLLTRAKNFTARKLTAVNSAISTIASTTPRSVILVVKMFDHWLVGSELL